MVFEVIILLDDLTSIPVPLLIDLPTMVFFDKFELSESCNQIPSVNPVTVEADNLKLLEVKIYKPL